MQQVETTSTEMTSSQQAEHTVKLLMGLISMPAVLVFGWGGNAKQVSPATGLLVGALIWAAPIILISRLGKR